MYQNAEIYLITIIGVILGLLLVGFIVSILFLYQKRQLQQQKELARVKDEYEKEALRSQLEIKENTFKAVGQELHDNIGQLLSVAKLSLSVVKLPAESEFHEQIQNSREILSKAIVDLSGLTKSMHTERIADIGLTESIRFELMSVRKIGTVDVVFEADGQETTFQKQTAIFLFRMFQEIVNNILKHSKASTITVNLKYMENLFLMRIKDNGIGFNVAKNSKATSDSGGVGLVTLYNRASIIGARVYIDSEIGKGTNIMIQLPLQQA